MTKKLALWITGAEAVLFSLAGTLAAHAQSFMTVPSSTQAALTADIGAQLADQGTLALVILAIAIPLFFYVVHQLMGLLPKSRAGRR